MDGQLGPFYSAVADEQGISTLDEEELIPSHGEIQATKENLDSGRFVLIPNHAIKKMKVKELKEDWPNMDCHMIN